MTTLRESVVEPNGSIHTVIDREKVNIHIFYLKSVFIYI